MSEFAVSVNALKVSQTFISLRLKVLPFEANVNYIFIVEFCSSMNFTQKSISI